MPHARIRSYTAIALGTVATLGLWDGARGMVLPHFLHDLHLSDSLGASIFSASALGGIVSSFAFGSLSQHFGLKRTVGAGMLLLGVLLTLFLTLHAPFWLYLVGMGYGMGNSLLELSTSVPISVLYGEQQGGVLNLLHGLFGVGTLLGSLGVAVLLGLGAGWRLPLALVGLLLLTWAALFLRLPAVPLPRSDEQPGGAVGPLLRDPVVWAAGLSLLVAVAGEVGTGLWLPTYLQRTKGLTEAASAVGATVFFLGFTATRLAGAWLVGRFGAVRTVVALALVGLGGAVALETLPGGFAWVAALMGAGVAVVFATCLSLVATRHPARVNTVYGWLYAGGALAAIGTGPLMGWLGERLGLGAAMLVPLACFGLIVLLMGFYTWTKGRERQGSPVTELGA